ncbi:flagellar motor switch protein FliN [Methylotuvimicrobium alcaliphilum]|uniref:Flagellar motor switch protein FliN n=2 Tax=Methylotuvimicrobium alcaliphilum TaxID=271065 RepID=G4T3M7_META2|nr:flagellar motor switch protein FliN [Methylotuvimicrobium alcaliphilum]CCE24833.1 Flagellar motor switch protein FliN [Methylotuvimicrobium alcaliphilum 20Z]
MSEQDDSDLGDDWAAAMNEQAESEAETKSAKNSNHVETASFDQFDNQPHEANELGESGNEIQMDIILDIPVTMSMEIGRTQVSIRNLLQLNEGSVVELDRLAGEPMDVLVNGTLIAHGEVVVVNDKFGIRLTDVVSPTERVKKLR